MTREELKAHCERQVQQFERVEKIMPVTPNDWKRYEEHKLILELLEQESVLDKIRAEVKALNPEPTAYDVVDGNPIKDAVWETLSDVLKIIDKYKAESEG